LLLVCVVLITIPISCTSGSSMPGGAGGNAGGNAGSSGMGGASGMGGGGTAGTAGSVGTGGSGGSGGSGGAALSCEPRAPNNSQESTGMRGTDRWAIKPGPDAGARTLSLTPQPTTIADLVALAAPATLPFSSRIAPTERTVYVLRNVRAT